MSPVSVLRIVGIVGLSLVADNQWRIVEVRFFVPEQYPGVCP